MKSESKLNQHGSRTGNLLSKIKIYTQDLLSWHELGAKTEITADEVKTKDRNKTKMLRMEEQRQIQ